MDKIRQWTLTISAVSILSGILLSIIPKGKLKPAYKTLVSIILVYSFMLPFINSFSIDINVSDYLKDNYKVSENLDKYALENTVSSAEKAVEEALGDYFAAKKLECKFSVECSVSENEIKVQKVTVRSNEKKEKILALIHELGFDESAVEFIGDINE